MHPNDTVHFKIINIRNSFLYSLMQLMLKTFSSADSEPMIHSFEFPHWLSSQRTAKLLDLV